VEDLFSEFSKSKDVKTVRLNRMTMKLASLFTDTMGAESIEVVDLDKCADGVKERFTGAIADLKDKTFDTMINTSKNGRRVRVLVRITDDMIREMVVISSGDNTTLVRIKGKIRQSDIEKVINGHRK
jgi:hypothetical protein